MFLRDKQDGQVTQYTVDSKLYIPSLITSTHSVCMIYWNISVLLRLPEVPASNILTMIYVKM